ncbi:UNVERIFIED_CONTAM: putative calcium-binding protein [Sesamum angustifolium]|uniref:Calcium-binding protein n=1 Tax=Sesamum angustifolium TaxID=2727405 RepID=A0AAW2PUC4_9LAMI
MGENSRTIKRVSRIGSYAIASSITDPTCVSCTTFNILAPIYKRLSQEDPSYRESDVKGFWLNRNKRILDWLLCERASIICLQEFWVGNEELHPLCSSYKVKSFLILQGLLTAVHKDSFRIISHRELLFNDFGDRVAQLLHVELIVPFSQCRNNNVRQEILIVNTHLLFPHNSSLCLERLRQVYKILQYVESYQYENKLNPLPILLCGDWNGSKSGHVYKFLRSQGFISSYDAAHVYADADAHKLNLVGHCHGLCNEEVKELWLQADVDRNGVIDYKEFKQQIWNTYSDQGERERDKVWDDIINGTVQTIGFSVKNAVLFPAEVEKGMWPEDYSLSDHARLTVVFSPVRMPCSRLT